MSSSSEDSIMLQCSASVSTRYKILTYTPISEGTVFAFDVASNAGFRPVALFNFYRMS